jgi:hypothetical protein
MHNDRFYLLIFSAVVAGLVAVGVAHFVVDQFAQLGASLAGPIR